MVDYWAWRDTEDEKPDIKYKLCTLDIGSKKIPGWWTGKGWDGLHYNGQKVMMWKYQL